MRPNVFSCNFASDQPGIPDTRPGTWGNAGFIDVPIQFTSVPAGKRVRVTHIYGDYVMWPHGTIPAGSSAGGLTGLLVTGSGATPFLNNALPNLPGSSGCFFYIQLGCGQAAVRAPFDFTVVNGGLLETDHKMTMRQAVYLNDTGVAIHMETTMVVEFVYE